MGSEAIFRFVKIHLPMFRPEFRAIEDGTWWRPEESAIRLQGLTNQDIEEARPECIIGMFEAQDRALEDGAAQKDIARR